MLRTPSSPRGFVVLRALLALALGVVAASCAREIGLPVIANAPPTLRLTQAPTDAGDPTFYAYEIFWTTFDPDGRVAYCLYAVDPPTEPGRDTAWVRTTENRVRVRFRSDEVDSIGPVSTARGYHVFVIKAVDDRGAASDLVAQAFTTYTVAPTVRFVAPKSNHLFPPQLPPVATIAWAGDDPDGQTSRQPLSYRYRLFSERDREFDFLEILLRPDSLRRRYAPGFESWQPVSGETTSVLLYNMVPATKYIFAVVAFDEAGAYSPVFSLDYNLLYFNCVYTQRDGPRISVGNEYFQYTYESGGYDPDPTRAVRVEFPAERPIRLQWNATPHAATTMRGYRWAVDIERLDDETPRADEQRDTRRWSAWSLHTTQATLGPFTGLAANGGPEEHTFFLEAEDANGLRSLAMVQFRVVRASFEKDLLFVDDTRFPVDTRSSVGDSIRAPSGNWPSAAELDTFLFARGGVRWRYMPNNAQSRPGVFKGYTFDTLDTRSTPAANIQLSTLAPYRNVVWYTDRAVSSTDPLGDPRKPMPFLRHIHAGSSANALNTFAGMGGNVWMLGGGIAYNTLIGVNDASNDVGGTVFSNATGELRGGRTMVDVARWRSEILCATARSAARSPRAVGGWPGAPDYARLPATLTERTAATDPLPPARGTTQYYLRTFESEALSRPNEVVEDLDPDPGVVRWGSPLDTLYNSVIADPAEGRPAMTVVHAAEGGRIVFTGFPLWFFQRSQVIAVADFVLQDVFGLTRRPESR